MPCPRCSDSPSDRVGRQKCQLKGKYLRLQTTDPPNPQLNSAQTTSCSVTFNFSHKCPLSWKAKSRYSPQARGSMIRYVDFCLSFTWLLACLKQCEGSLKTVIADSRVWCNWPTTTKSTQRAVWGRVTARSVLFHWKGDTQAANAVCCSVSGPCPYMPSHPPLQHMAGSNVKNKTCWQAARGFYLVHANCLLLSQLGYR